MKQPKIEFWYEFASSYSYLSAERIMTIAREYDIEISWQPFLLGPIFTAQGWDNSPFNIYPAKGQYMWRDMERCTEEYGIPFNRPDNFPQNSLLAARVALCLTDGLERGRFTQKIYRAEYAENKDISDLETLSAVLRAMGLDIEQIFARSQSPEIKEHLKSNTEKAKNKGIFGAPSFVTDDHELFWGNDRLDQAVEWAKKLTRKKLKPK